MKLHGYSIEIERITKFIEEQEALAAAKLQELGLTLQDLDEILESEVH